MSAWSSAIFWVAASIAAYLLGHHLAGRGQRTVTIALAISVSLLMFRGFMRIFPGAACAAFPFPAYGSVHSWWAFPVGLFMLGVGLRSMSYLWERVAAHFCTVLICAYVILSAVGASRFDPEALSTSTSVDGLCYQTSAYTCGPAAAATLFVQRGIPSSEREMAEFCGTNAYMGTDTIRLYWAMRKKLHGQRGLSVSRDRRGRFLEDSLPCLGQVKSGALRRHWVVVLESDDDSVKIVDPVEGYRFMDRDEFLDQWVGVLIHMNESAAQPAILAHASLQAQ